MRNSQLVLCIVSLSLTIGASAAPTKVTYPEMRGLVTLPVQVKHADMRFVFDTGADHTIINATVANRLGIAFRQSGAVGGAGSGTVSLGHAGPQSIDVAGFTQHIPDLWVIDFGKTPNAPAGLVGFDFLSDHVVQVAPDNVALIWAHGQFIPPPKAVSLPLIVRDRDIFVTISIKVAGKSMTREAQIDTGSTDAVIDSSVTNAPDARRVVLGRGLGKDFVGYMGTLSAVSIGPYTLTDVRAASGPTRIGMGLLRHFVTTFDVSSKRMYLEPI